MAQKATKNLAASNTSRLNTTLYLTLGFHTLFWVLRLLFGPLSRRSLVLYVLLSAPQALINFSFERSSRPTINANGAVARPGDDLSAAGLTEYLWDVTYWTYFCILLAALLGDKGWWAYVVIPAYSVYAAWTTYTGMRGGYQDAAGVQQPAVASKRQAKMEKRGGQKVAYR
ncbi:DUF788-domain-containing protein [Dothidotthia symphoricarpi CBS 119687]|uniref:DUF788-domain-containing protein n=1 Tax=Dothidotthia symphoricarpi CBS 119687 TaxID=1392245 RepID=A0A6A5ZXC1_9PLEO|nr:DUF788-domain-containing protein [Dothidotthia symphoricarpi CBS 119687]KAF2124230.1 DUF788-domain-containing protein [Dothidotthia symphoricarpi CBS 119687]